MKSWLGIAVALACAFCVTAGADGRGARSRHRPQHAGAHQRSAGVAGRAVRRVRAARDRSRRESRPHRSVAAGSRRREAKPRRLTQHSANDTHPRWSVDGTSIYFLSSRTGSQQIWRLPLSGGEAVQITDYPLDVGTLPASREWRRASRSSMEVFPDCADLKCTRERLDASGQEARRRRASSTVCSCATGIPGATARARTCSSRRSIPTAARARR